MRLDNLLEFSWIVFIEVRGNAPFSKDSPKHGLIRFLAAVDHPNVYNPVIVLLHRGRSNGILRTC